MKLGYGRGEGNHDHFNIMQVHGGQASLFREKFSKRTVRWERREMLDNTQSIGEDFFSSILCWSLGCGQKIDFLGG